MNAKHPAPGLAVAALLVAACQAPSGPSFDPHTAVPLAEGLAEAAGTAALDPSLLRPPAGSYTLGPGDRLEIELVGEPGTRTPVTVGPDGKIYFYLLPGQDVAGLSLAETKLRLERSLTDFIRGQPRLTLTLREAASRQVWMLGRLGSPGIYPLGSPTTLLEAIAKAGGPARGQADLNAPPEDLADLEHGFVLRAGNRLPVDFQRLLREGDLGQNIFLQPDDFVYLPTAGAREVYVLGAVSAPRPVNSPAGLSLVAALAGAGGPAKEADLSHIAIVRGPLTGSRIAVVDAREILKGRAPDIRLQPRDIVYVPNSPLTTLTRYADLVLDTFARTVGANEGSRAVGRNPANVGVNVPLGQ